MALKRSFEVFAKWLSLADLVELTCGFGGSMWPEYLSVGGCCHGTFAGYLRKDIEAIK